MKLQRPKIAIVRGGGDLATGVIYRLWSTGHKILSLEIETPLVVRRAVSAANAVFDGSCMVENMYVNKINSLEEFYENNNVSIFVDPNGNSIEKLSPDVLVDCIMAKYKTGTDINMAPLVVGIGPGFTAQKDVHYVVETKRGHTLGRLISNGTAIPNTGVPGMEMGYTIERLLRSPSEGFLKPIKEIGDHVEIGDLIATVNGFPVTSKIKGVLRGLIHPSVRLSKGLKIGDVDPRGVSEHCFTITDKALAIGGAVLEAVLKKQQES